MSQRHGLPCDGRPADRPPPGDRQRRSRELRQGNVAAVLRELVRRGPQPRLSLSRTLGLTQSALTRIAADMMDRGLVVAGEPTRPDGRGRPRIPVGIAPGVADVLGVHLGSEHVSASIVGLDGTPLATTRADFDGTPDDALAVIARCSDELTGRTGRPVRALSTVTGGWVDAATGIVRSHRLLGWHDVPLRQLLTDAFPSPETVLVESSTRAHALADVTFGVTSPNGTFFHVFVGNVAETAVAVDGRVVTAPDGHGGDIWAMTVPGRGGELVGAELTDPVLVERARSGGLLGPDEDFNALVNQAGAGPADNPAWQLLADRARGVGSVIAELTRVISPRAIVVSSGVVALPALLDEVTAPIVASYPSARCAPQLLSGSFGPESVGRAAAACAIEALLDDPAALVR